ncbi:MAG: NAD-dependent epimerase/dehydratase family protein, partial [Gammaproteobacteria bacterium]
MNSCLVTGCSGFIGGYIVAALLDHDLSVRGLTREKHPALKKSAIELFQGDLTQPASITGITRDIDTIIHAAGFAHVSTCTGDVHMQTTMEGTRCLLAEAEKSGVQRFIFISSIKAMPEPGTDCLDESAVGLPEDQYGLSRRMAEELVLDAGQRSAMHVSILRPTLVYGPGCKGNLAGMLSWVDRGLFPPVPDNGNRRSMVDARDLARAAILAAETDAANGKIYIITDGESYSTRRIYNGMRTMLGKSALAWAIPGHVLRALARVGDVYEAVLGHPALYNSSMCSKLLDSACYRSIHAASDLGFHAEYILEDALPAM